MQDLKNIGTINFIKQFGRCLRRYPIIAETISTNQIESKIHLIESISNIEYNNVGVLGCWTMTILGLLLEDKKVTGYDLDPLALNMAKALFPEYTFLNKNVFTMSPNNIREHDLIINTSCEHMPAMSLWNGWEAVQPKTYFAFQSNNMFHVKDHTNCVHTLDDFIMQMPNNSTILNASELQVEEYTRFTIIGHV